MPSNSRAQGLLILFLTCLTLRAADPPVVPPWELDDEQRASNKPTETSAEAIAKVEQTARELSSVAAASEAISHYFENEDFIRRRLVGEKMHKFINLIGYAKLLKKGLSFVQSPAETFFLLNNHPSNTDVYYVFEDLKDQRGQFSRAVSLAIRANDSILRRVFATSDDKSRRELAELIEQLGHYDSANANGYRELSYSFDPSLRPQPKRAWGFVGSICRVFGRLF
jgi:hypothetical protein